MGANPPQPPGVEPESNAIAQTNNGKKDQAEGHRNVAKIYHGANEPVKSDPGGKRLHPPSEQKCAFDREFP